MFPTYLRKGILQLDRQISVLENECQNMELDKRKKKMLTSQSRSNHCSRAIDNYEKPTSTRNFIKRNNENAKRIKKLSPAPSSRVDSTSSVPSNCTKHSNRVCDFSNNKANKPYKADGKIFHLCSCHAMPVSNSFKQNKVDICSCENDCMSEKYKSKAKSSNLNNITHNLKKNCVIHKEVLFSNPDGSIEVTVKQKSNVKNQEENNLHNGMPCRETIKTENCNCQCIRQQNLTPKWADILSLDGIKQNKECKCEAKISGNSGDLGSIFENGDDGSNKKQSTEISGADNVKIDNCLLPLKLDQLGEEDEKNLLTAVKMVANKIICENSEKTSDAKKYNTCSVFKSQNEIFQTIQKLCDNLINEKDFLTKELAAKNSIITSMKKREEEYNSLISMLKLNLNKAKDNSITNSDLINALKRTKLKLLEQTQVLEALKKNNIHLKESLDKQVLENDRLKTEIQIYKLESQKHDVVITGLNAEIKRYKEEIGNFQKQISEHLACLKANSQAVDLKKMMEAIIQQSQIFVHNDLDMVLAEENSKESLQHNKLMHSSPTSTKTSDINSSWKQISSIKTQEINSEFNNSENKEFYQVYGGDISIASKNSLKKLSKKSLKENSNKQPVLTNFTSGLPVKNNENELSNKENIKSKNSNDNQPIVKKSPEKLKSGIDELLQGIKLKWCEEVYGTKTPDNGTIEDFLNGSFMSSICE